MADDTTQDSTQGTTTNLTLSPTYQPNTTIAKQPGLTVRTSYVRGAWTQLKEYAERAKVGLPPPVDTSWTGDFGTGNVTSLNLQRDAGDLATLAISVAEKDDTETWLLAWQEISKDIRTWTPTTGEKPDLAALRLWEALASSDPTSYNDYIYNTQDGSKLTGNTLLLAQMIREQGIESYLVFTPTITKISTLTSLTNFTSKVGKIDTPTSASSDSVVGSIEVSKFTALANQWLKTADRIQTALDGTIQRTEVWTGADVWNSNLYSA
ncbi:MAG: hypothetical protein IJV69_04200 [Kiritimatiellae bacterium]|nr:hypothetical protein [Kiritimatiellia bacterium]